MTPSNPERITAAGTAVLVGCLVLSFASVATGLVEMIPGTVLGWLGRVASLLVAMALITMVGLLALPDDTPVLDDGAGPPEELSAIPDEVRHAWWWHAALALVLLINLFLTFAWLVNLFRGRWPSEAGDAAIAACVAWLAFAFLWLGKVPPKLGGG